MLVRLLVLLALVATALGFLEHRYRNGFRHFYQGQPVEPSYQQYYGSDGDELEREIRAVAAVGNGRERVFPFYSGIGKGRK
ncbi:unnamed protein product, partial [Mesorhabditis spiculigera]